MTASDGAHIFPPRADDQRIIDAIAAQGGPFGFGVDEDFRRALGLFLGKSDAEIHNISVDDMWKLYLDSQGLVNAPEPFDFNLDSIDNYLLEDGFALLQEDGSQLVLE